MNPFSDLLRGLAANLGETARKNMQHHNPAYLAHEAQRLAAYADMQDTERQLARYGVTLGEP